MLSKFPLFFLNRVLTFLFLFFSFSCVCSAYELIDGDSKRLTPQVDKNGKTYIMIQGRKIEMPSSEEARKIWDSLAESSSEIKITFNPDQARSVAEVEEDALKNLKNASDKKVFLNAAKQRIHKNKSNDSMNQEIDSLLDDTRFDAYTAKLAQMYIDHSTGSKEASSIAKIYERYLSAGDYFSARLSLEIERQKNLISDDVYRVKISEIFKLYTSRVELDDQMLDHRMISSMILATCAELDRTGEDLTLYESITKVVKDWLPVIMFLATFRNLKLTEKSLEIALRNSDLANQSYQLAKQNYKLAEQKENREIEATKNLAVEPKKRRIGFISS